MTAPRGYNTALSMRRRFKLAGLAIFFLSTRGVLAHAQDSVHAELSRWIMPGTEGENYLRYLQTLGLVRQYPWSVRAFSNRELGLLTPAAGHPWENNPSLYGRPLLYKGVRLE